MDHCNSNNIFSDSQYGFRQRRGCILQLLKVFDDWSKFIDSDTPVDAVFLDFRKAFDCVPHKRLLMKIEKLGISGNLLKWIEDFLTDSQQRVLINGISSEWSEVSSGVPQGSVLGPLQCSHSKFKLGVFIPPHFEIRGYEVKFEGMTF